MASASNNKEEEDKNHKPSKPTDSKGWDGKLRVGKNMEPIEPGEEESSGDEQNQESEHEENGVEAQVNGGDVEHIEGYELEDDEDLLDDVPEDEEDIDLNHCRISSIPALRLERFKSLKRLCLRQNQISQISFPTPDWPSSSTIEDLDLYDNSIAHIKGLEDLTSLTSLDLSFNVIKHIKRVDHLKKLTDLYFVQNKISKIEGLDGLSELRNLELGGNRIREIENLDTLGNLKELWLGKNKITELKNLDKLQNLTLLSIQSNRITSPSLTHLSTLSSLTDLYISHNALTTLTPLSSLTTLRILDISSNPLTSISGLEQMTNLEELWASNCEINSFEEVERVLNDKEDLECVYFEGNPLETKQRVLYRNKVKLALPGVCWVDAVCVKQQQQQ